MFELFTQLYNSVWVRWTVDLGRFGEWRSRWSFSVNGRRHGICVSLRGTVHDVELEIRTFEVRIRSFLSQPSTAIMTPNTNIEFRLMSRRAG